MGLYHIHTLGSHDEIYMPNNEIVVGDDFNNDLYNRLLNIYINVSDVTFQGIISKINSELQSINSSKTISLLTVDELTDFIKYFGCDEKELKAYLTLVSNVIKQQSTAAFELALEEYRLSHQIEVPSRFHTLFACNEISLPYYESNYKGQDYDVYSIETENDALMTSDILLGSKTLPLMLRVEASKKYYDPSFLDVPIDKAEYLTKGKVFLKEKVKEVRKRRG